MKDRQAKARAQRARNRARARREDEKFGLSSPSFSTNTGYGKRQVDMPEQMSKPSRAQQEYWAKRLRAAEAAEKRKKKK